MRGGSFLGQIENLLKGGYLPLSQGQIEKVLKGCYIPLSLSQIDNVQKRLLCTMPGSD